MYLSIIILPFIGSIFAGLRGRKLGTIGSQIVTTGSIIISIIFTLVAFYEIGLSGSPVSINIGTWIDTEPLYISWSFLFDSLTISLLLAVIIVSSIVHFYSISYISDDPHNQRFFSYLSFFTASIIILVTGDNYFIIFLGWELIGLSSFLLISFWITRVQANKSAIQALTINRVGDIFLSIGIFALLWICGSLEYATIFSVSPIINETAITIICLFLFIGAISKSAQIPLHNWLPSAIEGPTPVSSLIHAATLVTAGVYLIIRSSYLLEYSPTALLVITWIGSLTALFAATVGLVQNDLKRVIAYSTCSQLGYIFIAIGLSIQNVSLFHLVNHAFFKSLLFLAAGSIIHSIADQQDIRRLGGIIQFIPFTYSAILIGSMSLAAFPFLTGFYSKDLILEIAFGRYISSGFIAYCIGSIAAGITAYYSFRLISITFFNTPNASRIDYIHVHEAPLIIILPLIILSILAIIFGYIAKDLWIGAGSDYLSTSIYQNSNNISLIEAEFSLSQIIKLLPIIISIISAILAIYYYQIIPEFTVKMSRNIMTNIYQFIINKWFFDIIVIGLIIKPFLKLGLIISKIFDRGIIEFIGPFGISINFTNTANKITKYDTGIVTTYTIYIILGIILLILYTFTQFNIFNLELDYSLILIFLITIIIIPKR